MLLTDTGTNVTLCHSIILFLSKNTTKLHHLHTLMRQLMCQWQVAGCEKQLTHWADCSIITQWVFFFILPLQHLILQTLKHRYFSKVKTENGFDPRIPSLAIQKSRELYQMSRETGEDFSKLFLRYSSLMQRVCKRDGITSSYSVIFYRYHLVPDM